MRLTGLAAPTQAGDAVTKAHMETYIASAVGGMSVKEDCVVASSSPISFAASTTSSTYAWNGSPTVNYLSAGEGSLVDTLVTPSSNLNAVLPVSSFFANTAYSFTVACKMKPQWSQMQNNAFYPILSNGTAATDMFRFRVNGYGDVVALSCNQANMNDNEAYYDRSSLTDGATYYALATYTRSSKTLTVALYDASNALVPLSTQVASMSVHSWASSVRPSPSRWYLPSL